MPYGAQLIGRASSVRDVRLGLAVERLRSLDASGAGTYSTTVARSQIALAMPPRLRKPSVRWIALVLAPAALAIALATPSLPPPLPVGAVSVQRAATVAAGGEGTVAVNTLSAGELAEALPGIGPSYADRIVMYRRLFGPIRSLETLVELGIPAGTVEQIGPLLRFVP